MEKQYIQFKNVTKSYGTGAAQIHALHGASFGINKGEFCILIGSSGAGKNTLLNMLGGMDTPSLAVPSILMVETSLPFPKRN